MCAVVPATESEFGGITNIVGNDGLPYHTYQLPSKKVPNVLLRQIQIGIPKEKLSDALIDIGLRPEGVIRTRRKREETISFVFVKISKEQNQIYQLKELNNTPRQNRLYYRKITYRKFFKLLIDFLII